jgi:hypothetical protein
MKKHSFGAGPGRSHCLFWHVSLVTDLDEVLMPTPVLMVQMVHTQFVGDCNTGQIWGGVARSACFASDAISSFIAYPQCPV